MPLRLCGRRRYENLLRSAGRKDVDKRQEMGSFPAFINGDDLELRKNEWRLMGYTLLKDALGFAVLEGRTVRATYNKNRHTGGYQKVSSKSPLYTHSGGFEGMDMDELWEEQCKRE